MITVGCISYGLAAALGVLPVALALRGRVPLRAGVLSACLISAAWAALVAAAQIWVSLQQTAWPLLAELTRAVAWQLLLIGLLWRDVRHDAISRRSIGAVLMVGSLLWLMAGRSITSPQAPVGPLLAFLVVSVFGLVLLEYSYRHSGSDERWRFKFAWLGLMAIFGFDLFLYSQAALFGNIDPAVWAARGIVNAAAGVLIAASLLRVGKHLQTVNLSRRFLFQSTAMLAAGAYLLFVSAAGYYIQHFGGSWAGAVSAAFIACALLFLVGVLASGQFRARIRVFVSKHLFRYKYDYRDEWLRFNAMLTDTVSNLTAPRERAIRALADLVDSPAGLLWSVGPHGVYHLAATWNAGSLGLLPLPAIHPLVQFLDRRQWVIDVDEARAVPDLYGSLEWPHWWSEIRRPWLVLPLVDREALRGFVILAQPRSPRELNWEDRDLLRTAARQVAGYVALLDTSDTLVSSRQFDAFNRLSAYLVHDLKNVSAQLGLVSSNAARHKDNPAFIDDALRTVDNAKQRMDRLLDQLRRADPVPVPASQRCDLIDIVQTALASCADRVPTPTLDVPPGRCEIGASPVRLSMAIVNLIHNAQEASQAEGTIRVSLVREGHGVRLVVRDHGCGMDDRFLREHLFHPFATTKGNAGMGIGMYETRDYVESVGGMLEVVSEPGVGTTVTVTLPLATEQSAAPMSVDRQEGHAASA